MRSVIPSPSGARPCRDLCLGELGPFDDQVEELELERGEEHGDVRSLRERVLTVEVAGVDVQNLLVGLSSIGGHPVECCHGVFGAAVVGEEQPQERFGLQHRWLW